MTANRIIQHIFQQPGIQQVEEAALEQLVSRYPYFTAARLLLGRKQYQEQRNLLAPAVKDAQLYSTDLHYFYRFITAEEPASPTQAAALHKIIIVEEPAFEGIAEEEDDGDWDADVQSVHVAEATTAAATAAQEAALEAETAATETGTEQTIGTEKIAETGQGAGQLTGVEQVTETEQLTGPGQITEEEPATGAEQVTGTGQITGAGQITEEKPATGTKQVTGTEQVTGDEQITGEERTTGTEQEKAADAVTTDTPEPDPAATDEDAPIKIFPLEIPEEETTLTFQPLYTDDYFAYKRLKEPEQAEELNEKGMAEMKSFTAWLRDLKTTFVQKASKDWYHQQLHRSYEDDDPEVSEVVEKMAMESITFNDDIISETLAEIWARQHQYQTAIQIYQKLSLLNPDKSAYFAQKIKDLQLLTEKN